MNQRLADILAARKKTAKQPEVGGGNEPREAGTNIGGSIGYSIGNGDSSQARPQDQLGPSENFIAKQNSGKLFQTSNVDPVHAGSSTEIHDIVITPNTLIAQKLSALKVALEAQLPELPHILKTIHTMLKDDPDTVRVLSDQEIGLIVSGLITHTGTTIITSPRKSSSKKTQPVSLDMLD